MAFPAAAEVVRVRSGEHGAFTRVVFDFEVLPELIVTNTAQKVEIQLPKRVQKLDTSGLFDKITTERIKGAQIEGDMIALHLSCDCKIERSEYGESLVIDVFDSGEVAASLPLVFALPSPKDTPKIGFEIAPQKPANSALRDSLARGLARAASQGLVDPSNDLTGPSPDDGVQFEKPDGMPASSVGVRTSIDEAVSENFNLGSPTEKSCALPDAPWPFINTSAGFQNALSDARRVSESKSGTQFDATLIAQTYVSFGLGAEAIQALQNDETTHRMILISVGETLDYGTSNKWPDDLSISCSPAITSMKLVSDIEQGKKASKEALRAAFVAAISMPEYVQERMLPALADGARTLGYTELGREVLAAAQSLGSDEIPTLKQVEIGFTPSGDIADQADEVIANNSEQSPAALSGKIEKMMESGLTIDPSDELILQSYLTQFKTSEQGQDLRVLAARVALYQGRLREGLSRAQSLDLALEDHVDVLAPGFEKTKDSAFLRVFSSQDHHRPPQIEDAETRQYIAQRLFDLGFFEASLKWADDNENSNQGVILRANALLKMGDALSARRMVLGVEGEEAANIRLEAQLKSGDLKRAQQTAKGLPYDERLLRRLGAWQDMVSQGDDPAPVSSLSSFKFAQSNADGAPTLQRGEEFVQSSVQLRSLVGQILKGSESP